MQSLARTWTDLIRANISMRNGWPDKLGVRRLGKTCRVRLPKLYASFATIDEISFAGLPQCFVLKPTNYASRNGVMLLHRIPRNCGWWDEMFHRRVTLDDCRKKYRDLREKLGRSSEYIAEELIEGEEGQGLIPFDYKLYVIDGKARFILQIDRNVKPSAAAFFFNGFSDTRADRRVQSEWSKIQPGTPLVPKCHSEMIATAERIAAHMDVPFVSVDMYATPKGPVLGELTPRPGGPYYGNMFRFTDAYDAELGGYWIDGLRRRGIDIPPVARAA